MSIKLCDVKYHIASGRIYKKWFFFFLLNPGKNFKSPASDFAFTSHYNIHERIFELFSEPLLANILSPTIFFSLLTETRSAFSISLKMDNYWVNIFLFLSLNIHFSMFFIKENLEKRGTGWLYLCGTSVTFTLDYILRFHLIYIHAFSLLLAFENVWLVNEVSKWNIDFKKNFLQKIVKVFRHDS